MATEPLVARGPKRATNLSISEQLLAEARELEVNLSQAAEYGLSQVIAERRAERWRAENQKALDSSNAFVERHGLPLAKYRSF